MDGNDKVGKFDGDDKGYIRTLEFELEESEKKRGA